jgi:hypothetical protein
MLWVSLLVVGDRGYRTWSTQAKRALYRWDEWGLGYQFYQ